MKTYHIHIYLREDILYSGENLKPLKSFFWLADNIRTVREQVADYVYKNYDCPIDYVFEIVFYYRSRPCSRLYNCSMINGKMYINSADSIRQFNDYFSSKNY